MTGEAVMGLCILVCDDDRAYLELEMGLIKNEMDGLAEGYELHGFDSPAGLICDKGMLEKSDLVILDIDMSDADGVEIAEKLVSCRADANIIFVTDREELVFEVFKYRPIGFVRKERLSEELVEVLVRALKKIKDEMVFYDFNSPGFKFKISDITYLESRNHYIHIHTKNDEKIIRGTMTKYQEKLQGYGFIRVHSGFLVNVRCIYSVSSKLVTLDGGLELPVSRKNSCKTKELYANYVKRFVCGIY
jgi:DNA-binding LytR/AlgR family response regulator